MIEEGKPIEEGKAIEQGKPQRVPVDPWVAASVIDVFVYVVVLNLFVQFLPQVIAETFTVSLLTAVLLKGVLEVVVLVKKRVVRRFREASTPVGKVVSAVLLWLVLVGSKFLVLEAVDLVFGSRVSLGGFVPVTALVITLVLARAGVRRLLGQVSAQAKANTGGNTTTTSAAQAA